ncbi:hypothetical protein FEZ33_01350 [Ruoffia tabacinasalis]|uniref:Uncharacterized protein n=1 Tax=Ruoffia tabacinasalis TaxID=87458 RepID=A0A5R9EG10_9LACT|nr:hypothetical protein [Ruoffia tabacinasalis]TLQ49306.1 hypothetical protein FEZ33_01350 [Ruoffia tabacinasalis]
MNAIEARRLSMENTGINEQILELHSAIEEAAKEGLFEVRLNFTGGRSVRRVIEMELRNDGYDYSMFRGDEEIFTILVKW